MKKQKKQVIKKIGKPEGNPVKKKVNFRHHEMHKKSVHGEETSKIFDVIRVHLKSDFLRKKTPEEREKIFQMSEVITHKLIKVAHQASIRTERILPIALIVCGAAPFCSIESLTLVVNVGLWLFGVDDILDEELLSEKNIFNIIRDFRDIIEGNVLEVKDKDELKNILRKLCIALRKYKLYNPLKVVWIFSISEIINGMVEEYRWRLNFQKKKYKLLPSYEDYLERTRYSSGVPAYIWAMLIIIGDESISTHLLYLLKMERLSSTCVRLSNDIESLERESTEGKLNSIFIQSYKLQKEGMSPEVAHEKAKKIVRI